jgi:hypothetical protein
VQILVPKLRAKPVRTASGIAVVAVMCKPHRNGTDIPLLHQNLIIVISEKFACSRNYVFGFRSVRAAPKSTSTGLKKTKAKADRQKKRQPNYQYLALFCVRTSAD